MNPFRLLFRLLLGQRLPRTQGTLRVEGVHGRIRLHRDAHGVAVIELDDWRDHDFALGFCHGQDRTFQLEILLRLARGQLAQLVGPAALPIDRLSRRIGFNRTATQQWPNLSVSVQQALQHYAAGIQAGITLGQPSRPHEFALLGCPPSTWTPLDTLAVTKLLSFNLASNWDAELVRLKVLTEDGPEALRALDATYPAWQPVPSRMGVSAGQAVDALAAELAVLADVLRPGAASNNWALSGKRTASGRPLLACDPHLDASLPSPWYLVGLTGQGRTLAGASFVGGPLVLIGHNGYAAWGVTAGLVDNTDLFLEEIGPDGRSIRQGDDFVPCEVVEEIIAVKGAKPHTELVLLTPRGPIVSPALADTPQALSLRATWLDPLPIRGFFELAEVRSFEQFRQAFADWPVASLNLVYADISDTIGWQLVGRTPVRRTGSGRLPLPGWLAQTGWLPEAVSFEAMPHVQDPECGWVATANTSPVTNDRWLYLPGDYLDGYRLATIQRRLEARTDWDVAATQRLQMDQTALAWEELRPHVLQAPVVGPAVQAVARLRDWDGRLDIDSRAAAVYELFLAEMICRVARAKAPRSYRWVVGAGLSPLKPYNFGCFRRTGHLVALLRRQPDGWFARTWPEEIADALATVWAKLSQPKTRDRGWGQLRPLWLRHPLSRSPGWLGWVLGRIFNLGPIPCGGDCDVINQAAALPLEPLHSSDNIASLRAVIDVGAWHNSRFVLPAGQSGNPLSPHYEDLLPLWRSGQGVPIACSPQDMQAAARTTLTLLPGE